MLDIFGFDPTITVVLFEGGPCSGKTTILAVAEQWLEDHGFVVITSPEVVTELGTSGLGPLPLDKWKDPLVYQKLAIIDMLHHEEVRYTHARNLMISKRIVILVDRAPPGSRAYIGDEAYADLLQQMRLKQAFLFNRYDQVVHLVTAADGAEGFFTLANNKTRSESPDQARELDQKTWSAYEGHPHHVRIDNSTNFAQKITRALSSLSRVLHMPEPLEKERRFLTRNLIVPEGAVVVEIVQDYLVSKDASVERRVRRRTLDGVSTYYYTEKSKTAAVGERVEHEQKLPDREAYEAHLKERDTHARTIKKLRHIWNYRDHTFEYDMFQSPPRLQYLEVEVADMNEKIEFAPEWEFVGEEVTGDNHHSNWEIAHGSVSPYV